MIYAINYDLNRPGQNYAAEHEAIKSCGVWWHLLGSTWLVDTALDAEGIWWILAPQFDENDSVLVIGVTRDYQGWLPKDACTWIQERHAKLAA